MAQGEARSVALYVQVDVVDDTTPQLGGDLDVNGHKIVSVANGDIDIEPNGTGNIILGTVTLDADQVVGAGQDDYVLTYDNGTGLISLEAAAGGSSSPLTTKGDLWNFTTVDARLPIGTDTHILTADSLEASGMKWAAVPSSSLSDLSDVTSAAVTAGFALVADGAAYVGRALLEADISDLGAYLANISEDASPQLGADLDLNGSDITDTGAAAVAITKTGAGSFTVQAAAGGLVLQTTSGNSDVTVSAHGTGNINIGTWTVDADQTMGVGQDGFVLTYDNTTGLVSFEAAAGGGGGVSVSGTPVNNQLALWTAADTLEGDADLTYDGTTFKVEAQMFFGNGDGLMVLSDTNGLSATTSTPQIRFGYGASGTQMGLINYAAVAIQAGEMVYSNFGGGIVLYPGRSSGDDTVYVYNASLQVSQDVVFLEQAAKSEPTSAGEGYLWVRNDAPNVLVFTDDAGTDWDLNTAGGGAGDVTKVGTPVNNELAVWTGDGTLESESNLAYDGTTLTIDAQMTFGNSDGKLILTDTNGVSSTTGTPTIQLGYGSGGTQMSKIRHGAVAVQAGELCIENFNQSIVLRPGVSGGTDTVFVYQASLRVDQDIFLLEQADHTETPTAGNGYIWVKSDTPNNLIYTDDAGNDWRLNGFAASTTALASLNVPHGAAPTSPVDGDIWTTTAGLYVRINGSTVGPLS